MVEAQRCSRPCVQGHWQPTPSRVESQANGLSFPEARRRKATANAEIIGRRTNKRVVVVPPGGVLGEYVPFYFSGHSPMLLNIATGYGVPRIPQRDIVFLVCDAFEIAAQSIPFCFTDGNATKSISRFYNTLDDLDKLDWGTIRATLWKNTGDDYDRVRKKRRQYD